MRAQDQKINNAPLIGTSAIITGQFDLHREVAVSQWSIGRNYVSYEKPDSHTLSLYLKGGDGSFREDQPGNQGHAGAFCLMPEGHASRWHIGGNIDFAHLYFTDRALKKFAADHYDQDVRTVDLRDLTYQDDPQLRALMLGYLDICADAAERAGPMGEQTLYQIFDRLISQYNGYDIRVAPLGGGLSPVHMRRVRAAIKADPGAPLSIAALADLVGLSPYHFARKFRESFGQAPAQYITRQRIEAVKTALLSDEPLAMIAARTGFAQQSHMTMQFKKHTGFTPLAYRNLMRN